jgi:DNA polymerase
MSIDIETRSKCDLKATGVYPYAIHPTTDIMCIAYKIDDQPTKIITPSNNKSVLMKEDFDNPSAEMVEFHDYYTRPEVELHAFNETFERLLFKFNKIGLPKVSATRWNCTMVRAYYYNLPADLKTCAKALGLPVQKSDEGRRIMLQLSKKRKPSKTNPEEWYTRDRYPEKFDVLYSYCITDVDVEAAISDYLAPVPDMEHELFNLDKEINATGLYIDHESVRKAQMVEQLAKADLKAQFRELTGGINPTQGEVYRAYVSDTYNIFLPNLQAATVEKMIKESEKYPPKLIQELKLRSQATKTSLSKLKKFLSCMTPDNRIHGALQFYGASSTGRWAGRLIQPQNLPSRNIRKDMDVIFKNLNSMTAEEFYHRYKDEDVIKVLSTCLRGFITPPPGHKMFMVDYSAIEGRVVSWLGDVESDLEAFRNGLCVYREFGKLAYGMSHDEAHALPKGSDERAVLKECILSLGYGVGHDKLGGRIFENTGEKIDIRCSKKTCHKDPENPDFIIHNCEARRLVQVYRETRPYVVKYWRQMESAVFKAMRDPDNVYSAGVFKFIKRGIFLHMRLPNGRVLRYPGAAIREVFKWGKHLDEFVYRGESTGIKTAEEKNDPDFSVKWRIQGMYGAKFFQNACQAIARDIMAEAMLRVQRTGRYKICLTVHDEIVGLFKPEEGSLNEVEALMTVNPDWAPDIPLAVEGELVTRYRK